MKEILFGTIVKIKNENLKSNNHIGVYVGRTKNLLCKVYLQKPIVKEFGTNGKKSFTYWVEVGRENLEFVEPTNPCEHCKYSDVVLKMQSYANDIIKTIDNIS